MLKENKTINRKTSESYLRLGIFGAILALIGDMLIGCVQFPEGADLLEGYLGAALVIMCAEEYIRESREFLKSNADNV